MLYEDITEALLAIDTSVRTLSNPIDRLKLCEALKRQCLGVWIPEFSRDSIALIQSNETQTAETSDGKAYRVKDELRQEIERIK